MNIKRILIPLLLIILMASMVAFGASVPIGPNFNDSVMEYGNDGLTIKSSGITHLLIAPDVISGMTDVTSADADYILIWDATDSALKKCDMGEVRGAAGGYTNLTEFVDQTAWRVFYSNAAGDVTELALGADGTYLKSNGAAVAPTFTTPAGGGDVSKVGTPADSQVGVWTGDGTIEGAASFTYDGANLQLTGDIGSTGTQITKGWFTDLEVTNAIAGSITGNAGTVTSFTPAGGSLTLAGADALTMTTTAATGVTLPTEGTIYGTKTGSISSANLLGSLSDETGTGVAVFGTSPTFTTQITTPKVLFDNGQGIYALDGNEQLLFGETASAVNYLKLTNSATTSPVILETAGSDTNIPLRIITKGASIFNLHATAGNDIKLRFTDADVSQPFTALGLSPEVTADTVGQLGVAGSTEGGMTFIGFTESAGTPHAFYLIGYLGPTSPTGEAAVAIYGWKSDGSTGRTSLVNAERILSVYAGGTVRYYFTAAGTAYADVAWSTFSPNITATGKDLLAVALEDANKPVKPYEGIPTFIADKNLVDDFKKPRERLPNEFETEAKVEAEMVKYSKSPAKIAIASARYLEYLTGVIDAMQLKIDELEVRIQKLEKPIEPIK